MNLSFNYLTEPKEFSQVSLVFIETKPVLKILVALVNMAVILILCLLVFKGYKVGLIPQEWFMLTFIILWLFFRKKFNRWVFLKKFNKQAFLKQNLNLQFSLNGIIWSGEKFTKGDTKWHQIKYVLQLKNGFIFALSATQFLWLPERVFETPSQKEALIELMNTLQIKLKSYPALTC